MTSMTTTRVVPPTPQRGRTAPKGRSRPTCHLGIFLPGVWHLQSVPAQTYVRPYPGPRKLEQPVLVALRRSREAQRPDA